MKYRALHNFSISVSKMFEYNNVLLEEGDVITIDRTYCNQDHEGHRTWMYDILLENGFGGRIEYDVLHGCFEKVVPRKRVKMRAR